MPGHYRRRAPVQHRSRKSDSHLWSSRAFASYGFGVARLATTLLTVTTPSEWRSIGVVIAKFSGRVVAFRSSPTVLAETPVDCSAVTPIRSGRPARARWSAATFFGLYRMRTSPIRQALASFATRTAISTSPVLVPTQRHWSRWFRWWPWRSRRWRFRFGLREFSGLGC